MEAGAGAATEHAAGSLERLSTAVHHQRVTRAHLDALGVRDLLELPPVHRLLGSHVVLPTVTRDIEEDWLVAAGLDQLEASCQRGLELCARAKMPWRCMLDGLMAMTGLWRGRSARPNTFGAWTLLLGVIEGLAVLREREAAAELYPLAFEAIETGTVVSFWGHRLLQTVAGIAAAAGGRWEQAETHYQTALKQAPEIPFRSEQAEVRRWYAQMLLDRTAPGDCDKARTLLGEATGMHQTIGMPKHLEMVEKMSGVL